MVMQIISKGLSVPWPEPLSGRGGTYHKDYRMNDFPCDRDGKPDYEINDETYFSWLADYLINNLPPLTPEQEKIREARDRGAMFSLWRIGDLAGWYENEGTLRPFFDFPLDFTVTADFSSVRLLDGGYSYAEYLEWIQDQDNPEDNVLTEQEYILEDFGWHLARQIEEQQFGKYWLEFSKRDGFNIIFFTDSLQHEPPDAGWRVYLGLALQLIKGRAERIRELEGFYRGWHEMIGK